MKVALSTTGVEGAKANMAAEVPGWDFEGIRTAAKADWNSYLSRIEVEGTDEERQLLHQLLSCADPTQRNIRR